MPLITLNTFVNAPVETVFDLSRSVDLHLTSAAQTNEKAVAGKTTGLMEINDLVTWQARHFGVTQKLTVKITQYNRPHSFTDEMVKGAFKTMRHQHSFKAKDDGTLMTDQFYYQSPLGFLGRLANVLFLERYMRNFLIRRNKVLREIAEDPAKLRKLTF